MRTDPALTKENKNTQPRKQPFRSLGIPAYRLFFASTFSQNMAMNMQIVARNLLIYRLTGSATILGGMAFAHAVPTLILSLFGGVAADRMQKKYIIIVCELISAVGALLVGLSLVAGFLSADRPASWWILVASSFIHGSASALMMPSRQAIVPQIVGEGELMNAVSLNVMGMNALRLLAPAMAGFLIDAVGFQAVFFTIAGLYCLAAVVIKFLPSTKNNLSGLPQKGALTDIKEGFKYMQRHPFLLHILFFILFVVMLAMPYTIFLTMFAEDILNVGAKGMGLLMSASGIGAVAGSLLLASLSNRKRGLLLLLSSLLLGVTLTGFSFSNTWYLSLGLIFFVGVAQAGLMTLGATLIQYYVEDAYRGRVMSIFMMEFGLMSLGAFAIGIMAGNVGVQWALGSFSMVLTLLIILTISFVPTIRKLD